jgi:hypothetical protein
MAAAPPGQPSATPRPAKTSPTAATRVAPQSSRFGTVQYQTPSGRGPLSNNPIYTALNLFGGRA